MKTIATCAAEYKVGQRYQGFENVPAPTPPIGHMDAIEPLTGKQKWRTPVGEIPNYSAMLATAGGLLFTGKQTGEVIAVDIDTGKILWEFKTGTGVNAQPITFTHKGRQYVSIQSGLGGVNAARQAALLTNIPCGRSVWTFALMED